MHILTPVSNSLKGTHFLSVCKGSGPVSLLIHSGLLAPAENILTDLCMDIHIALARVGNYKTTE